MPGLRAIEDHVQTSRPWRRGQRDLGYVIWASFLMACVGSAVFFAMVDPVILSGTTTPGWEISREEGYAIGFFGFWLLSAANAVFVIWLVRTEPQPLDANNGTLTEGYGRRRRGWLRRRGRRDTSLDREERP